MATKSKALVYKVARFNIESQGLNLQACLDKIASKQPKASDRLIEIEPSHFRVINHFGKFRNMKVGEIFDYTKGHRQPQANITDNTDEFDVKTIAPRGKNAEFLDSIMFFGASGNNLILSQTASMKALQLETYINSACTELGIFKDAQFVTLCDCPPLEKQTQLGDTRSIELKRPVELAESVSPKAEPVKESAQIQDTKSIMVTPKGLGWETLKNFLPDSINLPNGLSMDQIVQDQTLEVSMLLKWSRLNPNSSTSALDLISNQLRHVDEELDYTIKTKSGDITKDEMKLKTIASIKEWDEGLLSRESMWEKMHDWLQKLIEDERIQEEVT